MLSFLQKLIREVPAEKLLERLRYTAFDELVVIHPEENTFESQYHTEGKFFKPVMTDSFRTLVEYTMRHMVHPDDREACLRLMDPETMTRRLREAEPRGILTADARYLGMDGNWRMLQHMLIGGEAFGLEEGTVYFYLYDIREILERERGQHAANAAATERMRGLLPELLPEGSFLQLCDNTLRREKNHWCMIAVDVKHFKLFRELNGPENADELLIRFGAILREEAETLHGYACYRGQDDFGLCVPFEQARVEALFSRLRAEIDALSGTSGFFPILGICVMDDTRMDAMELFNRAALTAEEIKDDLQHHIRVYDPELHERHVEEFRLLSEFNDAMRKDEIFFSLQPQVHVISGKIVGVESLARWRSADGSFISPVRFVPVLEKYGVITDLDTRIWEQVCAWLRSLLDRGIRPVPVSVNVSRINILSVDVAEQLSRLMEKYDLPPRLLKVEITESAYVDDSERVRGTISELRSRGFQVMMDDFGSGYSSLNMLRSIIVDAIKLDAQFLRFSVGEEQKGVSILESVISMTKSLDIPMIVEGVETGELAQFLKDLGCRYIQGFHFYHPMSVEDFEKLLTEPGRMDYHGIVLQRNQQMHIREFLDENIYSDAMLNNILGPVAFYSLRDGSVDIIRFNEQFAEMIALDPEVLEERRYHIEDYFHPGDRQKFFHILAEAERDRFNGSGGLLRVYKPNGAIFWMQLRVYFLQERDGKRLFYGSGRDMTEIQYINRDLPGGYYRAKLEDDFEFLYVSQTLLSMLGYTQMDIVNRFDNRLARMIHPEDLERVRLESARIQAGEDAELHPYRVLHGDGTYHYVLDQSRVTDQFEELCCQAVIVDITEVMTLRNRMRLLEKYSTDCIALFHDIHRPETLELACYGLGDVFGMDMEAFRRALTERAFSITSRNGEELFGEMMAHLDQISLCNGLYTVHLPDRRDVKCHMRFSPLFEESGGNGYIVTFTPATMG